MCGRSPCDKPNCTWSRAHLVACEARGVMTWPKETRAEFYELVQKHRGPAALAELKQGVSQAWKASQQPSLL